MKKAQLFVIFYFYPAPSEAAQYTGIIISELGYFMETFEELKKKFAAINESETVAGQEPDWVNVFPDQEHLSEGDTADSFSIFLHEPGAFSIRMIDRFIKINPHRNNCIEMVYVYQGSCEHIIDGKKLEMKKGELCLLGMEAEHSVKVYDRDDMVFIFMIKPELFSLDFLISLDHYKRFRDFFVHEDTEEVKTSREKYLYYIAESTEVKNLTEMMLLEYYNYKKPYSNTLMTKLLALLLIYLERADSRIGGESYTLSKETQLVTNIIEYIKENLQHCTIQDLESHFSYSYSYINRVLKGNIGKTFTVLYKELRLNKARRLLEKTEMTIKTVGAESGFQNTVYFYRLFHEQFGCTPADYRKRNSISADNEKTKELPPDKLSP